MKVRSKKIVILLISIVTIAILFTVSFQNTYSRYILTKNFELNLPSLPFYFDANVTEDKVNCEGNNATIALNILNYEGELYNAFTTNFEVTIEENSKEKTLKIKESRIKSEASQIEENNKKQDKNLKIEETQKQKYETPKIGENEKEIVLDLKKFNELPKVIKTRLILYTINKVIGTTQGIQKIHLEDIIKLCQNNIGNKYLTPKKNIKIFVKKGQIFIKQVKSNLP